MLKWYGQVVERILFIHTKVHKGLGYIQVGINQNIFEQHTYIWLCILQGMNEICGPIYYVFASQSDKESQGVNIFYCFNAANDLYCYYI